MVLYKLCVFYVDRNSKMTTTTGRSFYIGPIGSFYNQVNDTGSWEPLVIYVLTEMVGYNYFIIISSPDPKVQVNYCHHLVSVVCQLITFQASSKPLGQLEPNLAGMFLGWSSTNFVFFIPVGYSTWLPGPILCSDWLKFQRFSSLKLNCKWMIIGMSFTKFLFLYRLKIQDGHHRRT